jgi:hypothetical protein
MLPDPEVEVGDDRLRPETEGNVFENDQTHGTAS